MTSAERNQVEALIVQALDKLDSAKFVADNAGASAVLPHLTLAEDAANDGLEALKGESHG